MKRHLRIISILFILSVLGCSTSPKGAVVGPQLSTSEYESVYNKYTQSDRKYEGFYQLYEVSATLVASELQTALLQRKSDTFLWDADQAQKAREESFQEMSNSTKVILILFTPKPRLNDLAKPDSIWKTYLTANGTRYEGTAKKITGALEKTASIYPSHNRFSVAYEVTFNVPVSAAEAEGLTFALTSHLGTSQFKFPAK